MYKLLIVEDDRGIADGIKSQTEAWGLEVHTVENFRNVLGEFTEFQP
ncbi:MAG TPA: DNA-binding response regulator, partial [Ruminococcaceae bacterium]|nr:DNA-binding response regulator [Oscillospiraceae bacterium]